MMFCHMCIIGPESGLGPSLFNNSQYYFCIFLRAVYVNQFTMCRSKSDQNTRYIDENTKMPL